MIMKNLKIAAALLACTALLEGCDMLEKVGSTPSVSISALTDTFDAQGEAVVQVALSSYALEDVTVVLAATGDAAAAVTMDKAVKIPVASKSQNVTVKLDLAQIKAESKITVAIQSATGATVGTPKEVVLTAKADGASQTESATISISADDEFVDNKANLNLVLSNAVSSDVTVELEVIPDGDFSVIPAAALTFDNPVTIKAGETSAKVTVTVDPAELPFGEHYAVIGIKNAGSVTVKSASVVILLSTPLVATEQTDWTISYDGRSTEEDGTVTELITVSGWSGKYYDLAVFYASVLEGEKAMEDILLYRDANYLQKYLGTYTIDQILDNENGTFKYNRFSPDAYVAILIDYDEYGNLTGKYAKLVFEVAQEEATDIYAANVGAYELTVSADSTLVVAMIENDVNHDYAIYFNEGFFGELATVDWDAQADSLIFCSQYLESYEDEDYGNIDCYFWGVYQNGEKYSPISGTGYPICTAKKDADGKFVFTPSSVTVSSGESIELAGFCFYGYITSGQYQGYYLTYTGINPLLTPFTMTRVGTVDEYFGGSSEEPAAIQRKYSRLNRFKGAWLATNEFLSL